MTGGRDEATHLQIIRLLSIEAFDEIKLRVSLPSPPICSMCNHNVMAGERCAVQLRPSWIIADGNAAGAATFVGGVCSCPGFSHQLQEPHVLQLHLDTHHQ